MKEKKELQYTVRRYIVEEYAVIATSRKEARLKQLIDPNFIKVIKETVSQTVPKFFE